eukprot:g27772.t1
MPVGWMLTRGISGRTGQYPCNRQARQHGASLCRREGAHRGGAGAAGGRADAEQKSNRGKTALDLARERILGICFILNLIVD